MSERSDMPARAGEAYSFEYSVDHALPRVVVPRGKESIPEEGWVVTGEYGDGNGADYYATLRLDPVMQDGEPKRATKDVPKDVLEALNDSLVERLGRATPEEVGSVALLASEVNEPLETEGALGAPEKDTPVAESEIDSVINQLDALKQGLSESDRTALWRFSTALYPHEEASAIRSMSEDLRVNAGLRYQAQDLQRELTKLRQAK